MKRSMNPLTVAVPVGLFAATIGALLGYIGMFDLFYYRAATVVCVVAVLAALPALRVEKIAALPVALFAAAGALLLTGADVHLPLALSTAGAVALVIVALLRMPQPTFAMKTLS